MAVVQPFDLTILPSAAYTVAASPYVSGDIDTTGCQLLNAVLDLTAVGSSGTVTVTIQGKDVASGKYYTLLASAALASNATTRLQVGPTVTAAANTIAQSYIPKTIRFSVAVGVATSTFSLGCSLTD